MNDRVDLTAVLLGSKVGLTGKVMPNGEIRRRIDLGGITVHITTTTEGGWQEAHFHKGRRETYTVIEGCMALASEDHNDDGSRRDIKLLLPGMSVTTQLEDAHNVYLYPNTTITTVVYGEPVGNPDKKGNDWWPAAAFNDWTKSLPQDRLEALALRRM